jgi:hypothetical protein
MRATTRELKVLTSTIRQAENKAFEQVVSRAFSAGGCHISASAVAKIAGKKLKSPEGHDLGDIDALGINLEKRVIFVGEAKDFELARIPSELAHEADHLIHGEKSALRNLSRRTRWVREHITSVLRSFDLDLDTSGWSVLPVIVTSRDLVSPRILSSDIPVVPIGDVQAWVTHQLARSNRPRRSARRNRHRR